jgi:hypothetical protein
LTSRTGSSGAGLVNIQTRTVIARIHCRHRTRYLSTIAMEYKKVMG